MRTKTGQFFEISVCYEKMQEDGSQKKETEKYVVDAMSFTEAEERITKEMQAYIIGNFDIKSEVPATYSELIFSDADMEDKWYKTKVRFIYLDEKTGKEKCCNTNYLVQASTIDSALNNVSEVFRGMMMDYDIISIKETKIMDVFEYKTKIEDE